MVSRRIGIVPFAYMSIICFQISTITCHLKDLGESYRNVTGLITFLIAGGEPANFKSVPFNVQFYNRGGLCSGSILTKKTVVTAAHCFDYNKNIGEMMVLSKCQYLMDHDKHRHSVWDFRIHPQYNTTAIFSDDIALIFIRDAFVFGPEAQPATMSDNLKWMRENETSFIATGWGATTLGGGPSHVLMETKLRYVSRQKCMKSYEGVDFSPEMFCLYGNGTSDTCQGDSGGGIQWKNMIVGIVSHGKGCLTYPGVYVNVYYYTAWIRNTTEELHSKYCETFG